MTDSVFWMTLPRGSTRTFVFHGIPLLGIPVVFLLPVPIVLLTYNVLLYLAAVGCIFLLLQRAYADNPNRVREWRLAILSGSLFASRRRWGGESLTTFMDAD